MKTFIALVLFVFSLIFIVNGFMFTMSASSALHQILGYMCSGFGVVFLGLIGVIISNGGNNGKA